MSEPTLAGDWKDDDGQVIDSFLDENTDGQKNPPPATEAFVPPHEPPKVLTRILGTEITLKSGTIVAGQVAVQSDAPVMVLAADLNRKQFGIRVNSLGVGQTGAGLGSDVLRWGSDPGNLMTKMSAPGVTTAQPLDSIPHTGPVWVWAPETNNAGAGGGIQAWVWSVTE